MNHIAKNLILVIAWASSVNSFSQGTSTSPYTAPHHKLFSNHQWLPHLARKQIPSLYFVLLNTIQYICIPIRSIHYATSK